jgi:hypothetical protein
MPGNNAKGMTVALVVSMTMLLLGACATQPVVDSGGCSWVKPLTLTDDEIIVFAANIRTLRPLTDQINAQNTTRAARCGP